MSFLLLESRKWQQKLPLSKSCLKKGHYGVPGLNSLVLFRLFHSSDSQEPKHHFALAERVLAGFKVLSGSFGHSTQINNNCKLLRSNTSHISQAQIPPKGLISPSSLAMAWAFCSFCLGKIRRCLLDPGTSGRSKRNWNQNRDLDNVIVNDFSATKRKCKTKRRLSFSKNQSKTSWLPCPVELSLKLLHFFPKLHLHLLVRCWLFACAVVYCDLWCFSWLSNSS